MRHDLNFTEIVHLTPELLITFQEDAKRALVGDGSCSVDNVAISCFASELCSCNRNPQSLELSSLMDFPIRLVAVRENVFVGCVVAEKGRVQVERSICCLALRGLRCTQRRHRSAPSRRRAARRAELGPLPDDKKNV